MKEVGAIFFCLVTPHVSVGHFVPSKANWRGFLETICAIRQETCHPLGQERYRSPTLGL